jgi:uncharacterized protein
MRFYGFFCRPWNKCADKVFRCNKEKRAMAVQENVQIVKEVYAAFGRGDIQGLLALLAEDVEWITPGEGWPLAGTYRGRAGVAGLLHEASEMLEISCFERLRVKATNRTFEGHWVTAFTVRNVNVMNVREYNDSLALARAFEMAA